jgi:hypothetical protein
MIKFLLVGLLGVGVIVAVVAAATRADRPPEPPTEPVAESAEPAAETDQPAEPAQAAPAAADELCLLHQRLAAIAAPIGDVETEAEFHALTDAQVTFYGSAAGVVTGQEAAAFTDLSEYYAALRRFYDERGWGTNLDLADAAALPRPPNGSATVVRDLLETRCGVAPPFDTPG